MKWAEAKTRLSFVTATLNSLRAPMRSPPLPPPSPLEQHDEDRRPGEVRARAGVHRSARVGPVAAESSVRYVATMASLQERPATSARRSTGAAVSNVAEKSVTNTGAIRSRSA